MQDYQQRKPFSILVGILFELFHHYGVLIENL